MVIHKAEAKIPEVRNMAGFHTDETWLAPFDFHTDEVYWGGFGGYVTVTHPSAFNSAQVSQKYLRSKIVSWHHMSLLSLSVFLSLFLSLSSSFALLRCIFSQ